jgi:hypothetical protein
MRMRPKPSEHFLVFTPFSEANDEAMTLNELSINEFGVHTHLHFEIASPVRGSQQNC